MVLPFLKWHVLVDVVPMVSSMSSLSVRLNEALIDGLSLLHLSVSRCLWSDGRVAVEVSSNSSSTDAR